MKSEELIPLVKIPEIKQEIIEAKDNHTLAIFIGAGVSRIMGCPSWESFAKELIDICYQQGHIKYKEKDKLLSYQDNKKIISICFNILKNRNSENTFYDKLDKLLKKPEKKRT